MKLNVKQINRFILLKLPSIYLCGVRLNKLNNKESVSKVKFSWINKNPFRSIYFAVLAMAAELSTGALLLRETQSNENKFSTLVVNMNAKFLKKAVGTIYFKCVDDMVISKSIKSAIKSKEGVSFVLKSIGVDKQGDEVAHFEFTWSIKIKG